MVDDLWWREEDAAYIRRRGDRYPGATNIEPEWTLEAMADPRRIVRDPDPKSRIGAVRIIGYSPGAGFVITIIATAGSHAGVTAWKSSGADLREHERRGGSMSERGNPSPDDVAIAAEVEAVRAEYADEEAEAAELEAAENAAALEVPLSLRITRDLDSALRRRAATEQVSPSALVRRILRDGLRGQSTPVMTTEQVEQIVRRVMRESA